MDFRTELHRAADQSKGGYEAFLKNYLVKLDMGDISDSDGAKRETVHELLGAAQFRTVSTNTSYWNGERYESTASWAR